MLLYSCSTRNQIASLVYAHCDLPSINSAHSTRQLSHEYLVRVNAYFILAYPMFCTSFIVSVTRRVNDVIPRSSRGGWESGKLSLIFHFPIPLGSFGYPCSRARRSVAQRRVWPDRVVVENVCSASMAPKRMRSLNISLSLVSE